MSILKHSFGLLQRIGKAMMLPVSVLPVAGILLGVGSSHFGFIPAGISELMAQSGGAIFGSLPLIFAIAVAVGLANNDGVAALAATVGFVVQLATMGVVAKLLGHETKLIMGMPSIETGVFGGIIIGGIAAGLFNKYFKIQLPTYLGFFAGKRFVPIVTAFAAIGTGIVLSVIWPPIGQGIATFSRMAAYGNPTLAATLYGVIERLLIPFGLHHIWNVPFFFEIGEYVDQTGKVVHGDINRFFAGDPTAGILGGAYLFKMWGLPAAAIAIWQCAKPSQKAKVGSIMISAALTSFLTGITEPIEFSFLFIAPVLYLVHALFAGAAQLLFGLMGAKLGFTFSQGFIDYLLYFRLDTKPWLVLIFGPLYALIYYGAFRALILKFNLTTPGREAGTEVETLSESSFPVGSMEPAMARAVALVRAFGGRGNIQSLDACITRLRVELKDMALLNTDRLKQLGASGVLKVGTGAQAVFGPQSETLRYEMEEALKLNLPELNEPDLAKSAGSSRIAPSPVSAQVAERAPAQLQHALSERWFPALGGASNILSAQPCAATRVRVVLKDLAQLDLAALKRTGVQDVMVLKNQTVHLVLGLSAEA